MPPKAVPSTSGTRCPRWGDRGHNWMGFPVRGWLPWRYYRICVGCGHEERIGKTRRLLRL